MVVMVIPDSGVPLIEIDASCTSAMERANARPGSGVVMSSVGPKCVTANSTALSSEAIAMVIAQTILVLPVVAALSRQVVADGLRDSLDPKLRGLE